ncbi:MAG: T9SS type A sorting domain-containing protein [Saprospiraceae bacterium]
MKQFILIFFILFSLTLQAQRLISRFDPSLQNYFQAGQMLQGNTQRIYSSSSDQPYITDWRIQDQNLQSWFAEDSTFGYPLIFGAYKMFLLSFPNDDAIIVSNNFDCDIGGTDIVYLTADRKTKWHISGYDIELYPPGVSEIGLVAKDVLALLLHEGETLYVDFDGIQRTYAIKPEVYTHILYHDQSIYGYRDHQWLQLDTTFHVVHSMAVDTIIYATSNGSNLLLQTNEKLVLVDDTLQVLSENLELKDIHSASKGKNQISVINTENLYILDFGLQLIHQYSSLPQEIMQYAAAEEDTVFVLSRYNGIRHSDFVIRQYVISEDPDIPSLDLSFDSLVLPDTVFVDSPIGAYWAIQLNFDTIFLDITNNSTDTIRNFRVECNWDAFGVQCSDYQKTWYLDQLSFLPGETRIFTLNPFRTDTISSGYHSPFCFWIESPNGLPDPDPSNNYACDDTRLTVSSKEIAPDSEVRLYPNPCNHGVYIDMDESQVGMWTIDLLSIESRQLEHTPLTLKSNWISMENYPSGFYVLRLTDKNGRSHSEKLIIQH